MGFRVTIRGVRASSLQWNTVEMSVTPVREILKEGEASSLFQWQDREKKLVCVERKLCFPLTAGQKSMELRGQLENPQRHGRHSDGHLQ